MKWKKILKGLMNRGFNYNFEEALKLMETDRKRLSKEIIEQVMTLPGYGEVYKRTYEVFGIKRSAELAILVIELPLYLPLVKLKGLLGLPNKNEGRYNHRLRGHVSAFATSLYLCVNRGASVSNEVIESVGHLPKRLAISKLELIILKTLRITYLTIMKMKTLADGQ